VIDVGIVQIGNEVPARFTNDRIQIPRHAEISRIPVVSEAAKLAGESLDYRPRV
jgi:hypothetical protein